MRDECEHGMLRRKCDRCEEHAEIERLRTRLAEIEHGHSIALHEIDRLMKERDAAEAEVGRLTEQDGAMLRNTMEALHAAEAERDDLLGALREIVDAIDVLAERAAEVGWIDKDQQVEARVDRARAAIAKVGGK